MFAWYSSLPVMVQWIIAAPFIVYFLGIVLLFYAPAAAEIFETKAKWLVAPLFYGLILGGFLASIMGCTVLLSNILPDWLAFVISLPLGMFLFFIVGSGVCNWVVDVVGTFRERLKR